MSQQQTTQDIKVLQALIAKTKADAGSMQIEITPQMPAFTYAGPGDEIIPAMQKYLDLLARDYPDQVQASNPDPPRRP